jgi:hypothetical protein
MLWRNLTQINLSGLLNWVSSHFPLSVVIDLVTIQSTKSADWRWHRYCLQHLSEMDPMFTFTLAQFNQPIHTKLIMIRTNESTRQIWSIEKDIIQQSINSMMIWMLKKINIFDNEHYSIGYKDISNWKRWDSRRHRQEETSIDRSQFNQQKANTYVSLITISIMTQSTRI